MPAAPVTIPRPQRWDVPFGPAMTPGDADRLLGMPPFSRMDAARFPPGAPLRDLLLNDTRILRYRNGDLVVREGDYGNSAFLILSGAVRVAIDRLPEEVLGRRPRRHLGLLRTLAQLWSNPRVPEARDPSLYRGDARIGAREAGPDATRIFLQDVPAILDAHRTVRLEAGELFGEIAALGRTPRTATVFADGDTELLEIRWQGLRDLRLRAAEFREHVDRLYRERSLKAHLHETPVFRGLDDASLDEVVRQVRFETYGSFDWHGSFRALAESDPRGRLEQEPIIAEEGHYPNGLILIRSGFARLSRRQGTGHRTVSYLGRGQTYGFEELAHNWRSDRQVPWQRTLRAVGYVDVLLVPTSIVEGIVLPSLPPERLPPLIPEPEAGGGDAEPRVAAGADPRIPTGILEFLVDRRFINGTSTMLIDLDRCTRCDACVVACAVTHDNNPRFVRHGPQHGRWMVANACMHCDDPVCMIGCPTGAIHRDVLGGMVVINDATCIGCATCAQSCPYDNIRMVEIRGRDGHSILDEASHLPILKATKCDLGVDQRHVPACERACPHDALIRVDMRDRPSLAAWLQRA